MTPGPAEPGPARRATVTPTPALFSVLAGALAFVALVRGHFDADYFWHLATGRLILESQAIPRVDPFSFTWAGEPWIPDQWLGEVVIAALHFAAGDAVMLAVFGAVAAIGPVLVVEAARRGGARMIIAVPLAVLVAVVLLPQVTARPQVISFALCGALLALLMRARPENGALLWVIPVLMLAWANIHGFYIVGLGVVAVYAAATLFGDTPMRTRKASVVAVAIACGIAAIVTPQGPAGVLYALSFLDTADLGTREIAEWQSPDFHNLQFVPFLGLVAGTLAFGVHRAPRWMAIVAVVGLMAGLFAVRTIGIAAILVLPALLAASGGMRLPIGLRPVGGHWLELGVAGLVAVVLVGTGLLGGPVAVDPRRAPTLATAILADRFPDARVLADYGWGGYVINELYPVGGRVFVDGRMHKYVPDVLDDYLAIIDAEPKWLALVDAYDVEAMLLPPSAPLVRGAAQDAGWCEWYRDEREVLMVRECDASP